MADKILWSLATETTEVMNLITKGVILIDESNEHFNVTAMM